MIGEGSHTDLLKQEKNPEVMDSYFFIRSEDFTPSEDSALNYKKKHSQNESVVQSLSSSSEDIVSSDEFEENLDSFTDIAAHQKTKIYESPD